MPPEIRTDVFAFLRSQTASAACSPASPNSSPARNTAALDMGVIGRVESLPRHAGAHVKEEDKAHTPHVPPSQPWAYQ